MATLISYHTSDGCKGRCDAKCYEAVTPICTCICGGSNHGVGYKQACQNRHDLVEEWIEAFKVNHPDQECQFNVREIQMALFD